MRWRIRPVPVVLRRFAFRLQLYERILAEGYPHDAQAGEINRTIWEKKVEFGI